MVKISVIMPVYNGEKYLEKTCLNLSKQTLTDIELICVNDGSTDNSLNILEKLADKYDFIKIINQENQGSGVARNNGIENAIGEYIAFLDADDIYVDVDALEKMYEYGSKHDADMVGANQKRVSIDGNLEDNFNYKQKNYTYFSDYGVISPQEYGIPWAFYKNIFKRSFLNKHNITFPNLKRGQDPVFLAEVLTKVNQIYVVCTDLYGYNYALGGGANSKVNDYNKKLDYMNHYKMTFKILDDAHFTEISNSYKKQLITYLKLKNNRNDKELFEIVHKIFEDDNKTYFENVDEEIIYLELCLVNPENKDVYTFLIESVKSQLYSMNINNIQINPVIFKKYLEVLSVTNYSPSTNPVMCQLRGEIENSNSWKCTLPIRLTKNMTIKVLKKIKNKVL